MSTFEEVLRSISSQSKRAWVYLPKDEVWGLASRSAVLESEEVPPELEDDPEAGVPEFAKSNDLQQALAVVDLQDIVYNALEQKPLATMADLFAAFVFYYDRDAFIVFDDSADVLSSRSS